MRRSIAVLLLALLGLGCDSVSPTAPIEHPRTGPILESDPVIPVRPDPCDPSNGSYCVA